MDLEQARRDLFNEGFWFRGSRQRGALDYLAGCDDPEAVNVLAEALVRGHRRAPEVRNILLRLTPSHHQVKIDRLWQLWFDKREKPLSDVLVELNCPAQDAHLRLVSSLKLSRKIPLKPEPRVVRGALDWLADQDPDIRRGLLETLKKLPNNERLNDELFEAWCKRESTELEALIKSQGRKPARLELEALFHLVTGQPRQYQALNDDNGQYFLQAYLMAPASFRPRINETVAKSGHAQLVAIYRKVLAGREGFDGQLYVNALKAAGDEDSLFDLLRDQTLMEALDFCKRWAETGRLPAGGRRRQAAEAAVKAYRALGQATFEQGPAPPEGLRDLFAVWQEPSANPPDPKASDPLLRAQALYLGQQAGPGTDRQIEEAARSDDWPLRLVARLLNPALAGTADHVQWIGALSGADGDVLGAPLRGTSNDYMRYSKRLAQARQGGRAETHGVRLLEILCAFLGAFVAGEVIVDDSKEATERGAVTVEDAVEDAPLESF